MPYIWSKVTPETLGIFNRLDLLLNQYRGHHNVCWLSCRNWYIVKHCSSVFALLRFIVKKSVHKFCQPALVSDVLSGSTVS